MIRICFVLLGLVLTGCSPSWRQAVRAMPDNPIAYRDPPSAAMSPSAPASTTQCFNHAGRFDCTTQ
jgi:hypothetical protein